MLRTTLALGCVAAFLLASPNPRLGAAEEGAPPEKSKAGELTAYVTGSI